MNYRFLAILFRYLPYTWKYRDIESNIYKVGIVTPEGILHFDIDSDWWNRFLIPEIKNIDSISECKYSMDEIIEILNSYYNRGTLVFTETEVDSLYRYIESIMVNCFAGSSMLTWLATFNRKR